MKAGYQFFLKNCLLPITPEKLTIRINNANQTLTLIDQGEINILKTMDLQDVEFDCTIPNLNYPFATYKTGFLGATYFLSYFESLKTSKKPFQFIVVRTRPNGAIMQYTNLKVSMESYQLREDAKNAFDIEVRIRLKQYRSYGTKTVSVSEDGTATTVTETRSTETAPDTSSQQSYSAQSGDSLFGISKKYYGDGEKYTDILAVNESITDPNNISAGMKITIPTS